MTMRFDAVVVGTGQAGPSLASRLAGAGLQVAVVERGRLGGTCVNTGCMPTKAMVASAYVAHQARRAAEYGVQIEGPVTVDMKAVSARRAKVSRDSREGLETWLGGMKNCTVIRESARFVGPLALVVGEQRLEAERIFLNVGCRPEAPMLPGLDRVPYFTSDNFIDVDFLPEHLVVMGGSYIAMEFGQMFRRFGSRVTILERGERVLRREDRAASQVVEEMFAAEGITIEHNCELERVEGAEGRVVVHWKAKGEAPEVEGSHLLVATGRRPNTDGLGLEAAGVQMDARGYIVVDPQLRTSAPGVWALGDCNGKGGFTHTSYNDYEIVAGNLLDNDPRRVTDRIPVYGMFVDPPLARVGMNDAEARQSGRRVLVGFRPMTRVGRAVEKGETYGFLKILVDGDTKEILGATMLGTGVDEAIHCLVDAMYAKQPYTTVARAVHIHPTVAELIPTVLGSLRPLEV